MTAGTITVECRRETLLRRSARRPLQDRTVYTCVGPDGKRYQNTNRADLLALLRQRYGKVTVVFEDAL